MGFLLFKTEGDQPHHIHEFLFSEMKKRNDTIEYKASTPLESLVRDASTGEVTGVVAGGKSYRAKRGVIMCTGGFESDPDMLRDYTGVKAIRMQARRTLATGIVSA